LVDETDRALVQRGDPVERDQPRPNKRGASSNEDLDKLFMSDLHGLTLTP